MKSDILKLSKILVGVRVEIINGEIHYIDTKTRENSITDKQIKPFEKSPSQLIIDNAISLLGLGDDQYYHFPVDFLWWLPQEIEIGAMTDEDWATCKLLLPPKSKRTDFQVQWVKALYPQIPEENYIYMVPGIPVNCLKLVLPGRTLGKITYINKLARGNIQHIRHRILHNLQLQNQKPTTMLLIKRNFTRTLVNWSAVHEMCTHFCDKHNLTLEIFDDIDTGTVTEQLEKFHKSRIIIGCHGAGNTNIIACQKNTILIEFRLKDRSLKVDGTPYNDPVMFRNLADNLEMEYYYLNKSIDRGVSIDSLKNLLDILHIT